MASTKPVDFEALVVHHRECEMLAERMAERLRQANDPDTKELLAAWDAHQWPDFDKEK